MSSLRATIGSIRRGQPVRANNSRLWGGGGGGGGRGGGQWRRRAGEQARPLEAAFPEIKAARLKLVITDYRNPPLDIESVDVVAAARELVFANDPPLKSPLRLFYGNSQATPPHYDLER